MKTLEHEGRTLVAVRDHPSGCPEQLLAHDRVGGMPRRPMVRSRSDLFGPLDPEQVRQELAIRSFSTSWGSCSLVGRRSLTMTCAIRKSIRTM